MPRKTITASRESGHRSARLRDIPFAVNWFEEPAAIAQAMGLAVELPDINLEDPEYWEAFDRRRWRKGLAGKVDMTILELSRDDPDWVRLKRLGGTIEAWFDLEQGVVFECQVGAIARTIFIIRQLAHCHRLRLWSEGESLVTASETVAEGDLPFGPDLAQFMVPAGFEWAERHWILRAGGR